MPLHLQLPLLQPSFLVGNPPPSPPPKKKENVLLQNFFLEFVVKFVFHFSDAQFPEQPPAGRYVLPTAPFVVNGEERGSWTNMEVHSTQYIYIYRVYIIYI